MTNASTRVLEREILEGVMIVAEREKILPGFKQSLNVTLQAGDYAITCGLLSNPKGVVTVTRARAAGLPDPMELVGPVAGYKVWIKAEADAFVAATTAFTAVVKAMWRAPAPYIPRRGSAMNGSSLWPNFSATLTPPWTQGPMTGSCGKKTRALPVFTGWNTTSSPGETLEALSGWPTGFWPMPKTCKTAFWV